MFNFNTGNNDKVNTHVYFQHKTTAKKKKKRETAEEENKEKQLCR